MPETVHALLLPLGEDVQAARWRVVHVVVHRVPTRLVGTRIGLLVALGVHEMGWRIINMIAGTVIAVAPLVEGVK